MLLGSSSGMMFGVWTRFYGSVLMSFGNQELVDWSVASMAK